jgi:hypothetical protein
LGPPPPPACPAGIAIAIVATRAADRTTAWVEGTITIASNDPSGRRNTIDSVNVALLNTDASVAALTTGASCRWTTLDPGNVSTCSFSIGVPINNVISGWRTARVTAIVSGGTCQTTTGF